MYTGTGDTTITDLLLEFLYSGTEHQQLLLLLIITTTDLLLSSCSSAHPFGG